MTRHLRIVRDPSPVLELPTNSMLVWAIDEFYVSSIGHTDKELARAICTTDRQAARFRELLVQDGWVQKLGERYQLTPDGEAAYNKVLEAQERASDS